MVSKWLFPTKDEKCMGGNSTRNKWDYAWMASFFAVLWFFGQQWGFSTSEDSAAFLEILNFPSWCFGLNIFDKNDSGSIYLFFYVFTVIAMSSTTAGLWFFMKWVHAKTPEIHLKAQLEAISVNMVLLPGMQVLSDWLAVAGYTKQTMGGLEPASIARDCCLWMVAFELAWYTQHRLMHDNKFLWKLGHEYHHTWRRPEHMIGITNFAFDHIVEVFVTMSSALAPNLFFPINFYVNKLLGFAYMMLAVLVHWDHFPVRFHLNHHYLVTKNYGSHWPFLDMFFGTYHWGEYVPKNRFE